MAQSNTEIIASTARNERFTLPEIVNAIKMSSATPIMVADGNAMEIGTKIRALGNKQISVVVLA